MCTWHVKRDMAGTEMQQTRRWDCFVLMHVTTDMTFAQDDSMEKLRLLQVPWSLFSLPYLLLQLLQQP